MNTLNDQMLENVTVHMESGDGFEVVKYIPAPALKYNVSATTYTCVKLPEDPTLGMHAILWFKTRVTQIGVSRIIA